MSDLFKKSLSSLSFAAVVLASGSAIGADYLSLDSIHSRQFEQIAQGQDQTQYQNREKLEQRINDSGDHSSAAQNRNRYRYQEQNRSRTQSQAGSGGQSYGGTGSASGGRGTGAGSSGRKMTGGNGGGRR